MPRLISPLQHRYLGRCRKGDIKRVFCDIFCDRGEGGGGGGIGDSSSWICVEQVCDESFHFVKIKSSSARKAAPFKRLRIKIPTVQNLVDPQSPFLQLMFR